MFEGPAVTVHTTRFNTKKILRSTHSVNLCFSWISKRTATFYFYTIVTEWFSVTELESVYRAVRTAPSKTINYVSSVKGQYKYFKMY
jgi:hypothetical protein